MDVPRRLKVGLSQAQAQAHGPVLLQHEADFDSLISAFLGASVPWTVHFLTCPASSHTVGGQISVLEHLVASWE